MKEEIMAFIQKQKTAFVASVDEEGFPNIKAMFMPRKIEGNSFYFSTKHFFHASAAVYEK